jgi:hypothetical protein
MWLGGDVGSKTRKFFMFGVRGILPACGRGHKACATHAGLHTSISTIVKVLDDMYAGQMVMKQCCDSFGYEWSKWPPDAFESVQHRHEELVAQVRTPTIICFFNSGFQFAQVRNPTIICLFDLGFQCAQVRVCISSLLHRFAPKQSDIC